MPGHLERYLLIENEPQCESCLKRVWISDEYNAKSQACLKADWRKYITKLVMARVSLWEWELIGNARVVARISTTFK